jgi:hypothetical protein
MFNTSGYIIWASGTDVAGPFLFSGHLDPATKRVSLVKQYIGAHQVDYK